MVTYLIAKLQKQTLFCNTKMVTYLIAKFWTITISYFFKKSINYNNAVCCKKDNLHVLHCICCKTFLLVTCILNL